MNSLILRIFSPHEFHYRSNFPAEALPKMVFDKTGEIDTISPFQWRGPYYATTSPQKGIQENKYFVNGTENHFLRPGDVHSQSKRNTFCPVDKRCFFSGGAGGIRTLGTLLTYTRFPVVLVMTSSILLHRRALSHTARL